jgi:hypothetical protein
VSGFVRDHVLGRREIRTTRKDITFRLPHLRSGPVDTGRRDVSRWPLPAARRP